MPIHPIHDLDALGALDDSGLERIGEARARLLGHLAAGVASLQAAVDTLSALRSQPVCDVEFIDGRDGRDVAAFLDDTIRYARATYAVVHTVIDQEAL